MFEIVLHTQTLNGQAKPTINARDIHAAVESRRHYADWIKEQLSTLPFVENIDFVVIHNSVKNPQGGRPSVDHFFDFNAAKHIALTSKSEPGFQYRQALIDMEEQQAAQQYHIIQTPMQQAIDVVKGWKELSELFGAPIHLGLIEAAKAIRVLGIDATPLLKASEHMDQIAEEDVALEPTDMSECLGIQSGIQMNRVLEKLGLQVKVEGQWEPTDMGRPLCQRHAWSKGGKSGYNWKWNLREVKRLLAQYMEA